MTTSIFAYRRLVLSTSLALLLAASAAHATTAVRPVKAVTAPAITDASGNASSSGPDWKGQASGREFTVGVLAGLGVIEPKYGFAFTGNVSKKILHEGFIPDFNDQAFLEGEVGPVFVTGGQRPLFWSAHLRWDFQQDDTWTFFALAGLAGQVSGPVLGDRAMVFPRIGAGLFYYLTQNLSLRAQVSHEVTGLGVSFEF